MKTSNTITLITLTLIFLKLYDVITFSWPWVLSPLPIGYLILTFNQYKVR